MSCVIKDSELGKAYSLSSLKALGLSIRSNNASSQVSEATSGPLKPEMKPNSSIELKKRISLILNTESLKRGYKAGSIESKYLVNAERNKRSNDTPWSEVDLKTACHLLEKGVKPADIQAVLHKLSPQVLLEQNPHQYVEQILQKAQKLFKPNSTKKSTKHNKRNRGWDIQSGIP